MKAKWNGKVIAESGDTINVEGNQYFPIDSDFDTGLKSALILQHHAAQFISVAGHHLIPRRPDDSNTSMKFIPNMDLLVGARLNIEASLALNLSDLTIGLVDSYYNWTDNFTLIGNTGKKNFALLNALFINNGINVTHFKPELHYDLSSGDPFSEETLYSIADASNFKINSLLRSNAETILNEAINNDIKASEVLIWPHHFDSGSFIPLSTNNKGELSSSIGVGWAIPDTIVDEPYFYATYWSELSSESLDNLPDLAVGEWLTDSWKGAVLRHSEIIKHKTADKQLEIAKRFFEDSLNTFASLA